GPRPARAMRFAVTCLPIPVKRIARAGLGPAAVECIALPAADRLGIVRPPLLFLPLAQKLQARGKSKAQSRAGQSRACDHGPLTGKHVEAPGIRLPHSLPDSTPS